MKHFSKQKGVSLYIAIMIIAILLAIVLGAGAILLGQLKVIKGMENSITAFYAADTGIEKILYDEYMEIDIVVACPDVSPPLCQGSVGGANYSVIVLPGADPSCPGTYHCIKSEGTYKETKRAIQISR